MSLTQQQFDNLNVGDTVYVVITDDVFTPVGVVEAKIVDIQPFFFKYSYQDETNQTVIETSHLEECVYLSELDAYKELAHSYRIELEQKDSDLRVKDSLIEGLEQEVYDLHGEINYLNDSTITELADKLEDKDQELKDLNSEFNSLKDSFEGLEYEVIALKSELYDRDNEIQELRSTIDELNAEIDSLKV